MVGTAEMGYVVNLVLNGRLAVVVGGGSVAARKIEDPMAAQARVRVIAAKPGTAIRSMADEGLIAGEWRPYCTGDLEGAFLAIAATDDESVNARVADDAQAASIPVKVVDRPALCTFTLPAVARRGSLAVAVSTGGLCPSLAGVLRDEIGQRYGPECADLVRLFGELRQQMIAMGWDSQRDLKRRPGAAGGVPLSVSAQTR